MINGNCDPDVPTGFAWVMETAKKEADERLARNIASRTPHKDELVSLLISLLQCLTSEYQPGLFAWHKAYEKNVDKLLEFFKDKP